LTAIIIFLAPFVTTYISPRSVVSKPALLNPLFLVVRVISTAYLSYLTT